MSRNSTLFSTAPVAYWGQFDEISKYNPQLNVAERLWTAWYAWMQNDVLATGIMSFVMHELVYFGRSLPWIFIDSLGLFKNYKIQNVGNRYVLRMGTWLTGAEQNSFTTRTMGLCEVRLAQSFHRGTATDLVRIQIRVNKWDLRLITMPPY